MKQVWTAATLQPKSRVELKDSGEEKPPVLQSFEQLNTDTWTVVDGCAPCLGTWKAQDGINGCSEVVGELWRKLGTEAGLWVLSHPSIFREYH